MGSGSSDHRARAHSRHWGAVLPTPAQRLQRNPRTAPEDPSDPTPSVTDSSSPVTFVTTGSSHMVIRSDPRRAVQLGIFKSFTSYAFP